MVLIESQTSLPPTALRAETVVGKNKWEENVQFGSQSRNIKLKSVLVKKQ